MEKKKDDENLLQGQGSGEKAFYLPRTQLYWILSLPLFYSDLKELLKNNKEKT